MSDGLHFRQNQILAPDFGDAVQVFIYTRLDAITSPSPEVLMRPAFRAALLDALNSVGIRHNIDMPDDLKDILDVFIVSNATNLVD
jgi:hypothetical protein